MTFSICTDPANKDQLVSLSLWLPRPEHHCLLVTPPGTLLVVVNGHFSGFGVGTEDNTDVFIPRLVMASQSRDQLTRACC